MNLYIVLGYLGSGKTTFIKNFLEKNKDKKNGIIVNDFGSQDVDGEILSSESTALEKIYDGSIFCSCKSDMFANALIEMSALNLDNIIVESSGLANPFTMLTALDVIKKKSKNNIDYKGAVCLVDTSSFEKILSCCYSIKMQIALSDLIILNKIDLSGENDVKRVESVIKTINKNAKIIYSKNAYLEYLDFEIIEKKPPEYIMDINIQKAEIILNEDITKENLDEFSNKLSKFSHRIKGIVKINHFLDGKKSYIYEFINGEGKIIKTEKDSNFLIVLSVAPCNLKKNIQDILEKINIGRLK